VGNSIGLAFRTGRQDISNGKRDGFDKRHVERRRMADHRACCWYAGGLVPRAFKEHLRSQLFCHRPGCCRFRAQLYSTSAFRLLALASQGTLHDLPARSFRNARAEAGYDIGNFTLVMRRQTHTLFRFSADIDFAPVVQDEEVGVTVFLNQVQNINLGIVMLPQQASNSSNSASTSALTPHLRFLVSGLGSTGGKDNSTDNIPSVSIREIPSDWLNTPIRLSIHAENQTHYVLSAASSADPCDVQEMGQAPASIVSGGDGPFTGKSYACCSP
jgi:hypothetical protein